MLACVTLLLLLLSILFSKEWTGICFLVDLSSNNSHLSFRLKGTLKVVLRPKKNFVFPLDSKTMLTKHLLTQVLSSGFKKTPVYFSWNFLIYWSAITNFKILRELGRGENDVKHSPV